MAAQACVLDVSDILIILRVTLNVRL